MLYAAITLIVMVFVFHGTFTHIQYQTLLEQPDKGCAKRG